MGSERFDKGIELRRAVLGDAYVDAALAKGDNPFQAVLQELATEGPWGTIWSRPGLDIKARCMTTVALLVALNHPHELDAHMRGALRNGVSVTELRELLLHCSVYCGWPATVKAFKIAASILDEQ